MHIRKRSRGRYQAVIRIKNSYLTKTFLDRNSCVAWGKTQEQLLYNGGVREVPRNLTLKILIEEYKNEVVPHLKDKGLKNQLNRILNKYKWLVDKPYQNLKPSDFSKLNMKGF